MKTITIIVSSGSNGKCPYNRFDLIKFGGYPLIGFKYMKATVVRVRSLGDSGGHSLTVVNVKWSKFKFVNKIIRLYLTIRFL